ncbi:hypothetical protein SCLCIDRAFT_154350 [Scleroderma citrinum Foug A]|uniref:Uncharacterized protein n=1 Tax=Scleroderma citrinum Foug A TaxID=1036808 RepID=A0A0C3ECY3_9AGAM|nr:hypothetical protein SCLCIDRAFT_154350 [Scleroderma citrinum Foug A]
MEQSWRTLAGVELSVLHPNKIENGVVILFLSPPPRTYLHRRLYLLVVTRSAGVHSGETSSKVYCHIAPAELSHSSYTRATHKVCRRC